MFFYIVIFLLSSLGLAASGNLIIRGLVKVAQFLNWREFVVGFVVMSLAASTPNLVVGINAALKGIPELSFGDVIGGNVVDLTLVTALGALISGNIMAGSRMVQNSVLFTIGIAALPIVLIFDQQLSRLDGVILLLAFFFYTVWLFGNQERFKKIYDPEEKNKTDKKALLKSLLALALGLIILIFASQGIVVSAQFFAGKLNLPLGLIGILIVGLGNCLPEIYFTLVSAKKGESWLILGDLMGGVITCATLVLGIVAIISPIIITDFSPYFLARIFLLLSCVFFLVFLRTGKKVSQKEGLFLLGIYIVFLFSEILLRRAF